MSEAIWENFTEEVAPELGLLRHQPCLNLREEPSRKKERQKQTEATGCVREADRSRLLRALQSASNMPWKILSKGVIECDFYF